MQALQVYFFPWLKKHMAGFIHSENSTASKKRLMKVIDEKMKSISMDGSAFDSLQFASLMRPADNGFWEMMESEVLRVIEWNVKKLALPAFNRVEQLHRRMMRCLLETTNHVFAHFPDVNSDPW